MRAMERFWRLLILVAIVGLFGFLSGMVLASKQREAQRAPRVAERVDARQFRLIDSEGRVRAELGMPFGEPALFLYDREGNARAWILLDAEGNPKAMFASKEGSPLWQAPPLQEKPASDSRSGN
ncbi:MAG: hypothetical protein N2045_11885 [Fimbriimonadales bacterium]|nr:hypothetical protein [Fimbriimonadales bacterium]